MKNNRGQTPNNGLLFKKKLSPTRLAAGVAKRVALATLYLFLPLRHEPDRLLLGGFQRFHQLPHRVDESRAGLIM